jgi:glycerol-3-phosphate acyltransferase PlsX
VLRPAISVTLPTMNKPVVLIDGGANADCTPEMLAQFSQMGTVYAKYILDIEKPKVGILSIGEEEGKGNALVKDTYPLLKELHDQGRIDFVGNIEGKELFVNKADVVVTDGFAGNVALKVTEGTASMLLKMIAREFKSNILGCIIGLLAKPFLRNMYKRINWEGFGGMLLLGVKGISVIAHGRSSSFAMKNAVRVAATTLNNDINKKIAENINR